VIQTKTIKAGKKEYENPISVLWNGNLYHVACWKGGGTFIGGIGIFDHNYNIIEHLKTPRYTTGIVAITTHDLQNIDSFLVICIKQQSTSRSSTLLILDNDFQIVYKEYMGEVDWVGKGDFKSTFYLHEARKPGVYAYKIFQ